jgi:hypothetical protein
VDEEIKKGASFQSEKETRLPHSRTPKKKGCTPVPENKVVSLEERAKTVPGAVTAGRRQEAVTGGD